MEPEDVFVTIRPVLAQVLRVEEDTIQPGASLSEDLGAESIDLAEIQIVLEETYSIRAAEEYIAGYLMGELPASDFYDEERNVTPAGMQRLASLILGFYESKWSHDDLNMYNLWRILTVDALDTYAMPSAVRRRSSLDRGQMDGRLPRRRVVITGSAQRPRLVPRPKRAGKQRSPV